MQNQGHLDSSYYFATLSLSLHCIYLTKLINLFQYYNNILFILKVLLTASSVPCIHPALLKHMRIPILISYISELIHKCPKSIFVIRLVNNVALTERKRSNSSVRTVQHPDGTACWSYLAVHFPKKGKHI